MEIKSSPPRQIYQNEIASFFERACDMRPEMAIFFMDTELRMKDKIVPMFEEELKRRYQYTPEVRQMEKELFEISAQKTQGLKMFIFNAKDSVVGNIEKVLANHFRERHKCNKKSCATSVSGGQRDRSNFRCRQFRSVTITARTWHSGSLSVLQMIRQPRDVIVASMCECTFSGR